MNQDTHQDLFSRGVDSDGPPVQSQSSTHLDALFNNIRHSSEPATPTAMIDESLGSASPTERQSALLSLLGTVGPVTQVPTPPGSIQRSGPSPNDSHTSENQGKILLEQLMGSASRSNFPDSLASGPSAHSPADNTTHNNINSPPRQDEPEEEYSQEEYQAAAHEVQRNYNATSLFQHVPEQQPQQQRPLTPTRKSMFDFVSPFDVLANAGVKKKPVPSTSPSVAVSASSGNEDSWTTVSVPVDPKQKSVDNLMDQLTRGSQPQQQQQPHENYTGYGQSPYAPQDSYHQVPNPYDSYSQEPSYQQQQSYNHEQSYAPDPSYHDPPSYAAPPLPDSYQPYQTQSAPPPFPAREPSPVPQTPPRQASPPRAFPQSPPTRGRQSPVKTITSVSRATAPRAAAQRVLVDSGPESSPLVHPPLKNEVKGTTTARAHDSGVEFGGHSSPSLLQVKATAKEGTSPQPKQSWKAESKAAKQAKKNAVSSPQEQSVVLDVSLPLHEVLASRDMSRSTAIALVRQEAIFIPGTTIGCSHWVAYAMSKGRIRVIARTSGDRTLLNLPQGAGFPVQTVVTDMAVYGNRLAAVTSDGGFVIWELPDVIVDDAPGEILLCVGPTDGPDALRSVKFHPNDTNVLAVASRDHVFLIDIVKARHATRGNVLDQEALHRLFDVFALDSPLIAFDFDMAHYALGTISEDSTLTLWNIQDKQPFWRHQTPVDGPASSLTFVDGGIIIGRKKNTILQLLSMTTKKVLSTVKFINGAEEDSEMFGHIKYDSRIQTLWVSNSRREGLVALRLGYDTASLSSPNDEPRAFVEQVLEFPGSKPTIHFVILDGSSDPTGDEANAACEAAKTPHGELALVAFSVHSSGVDQILIRKEWYEHAMNAASSKFPAFSLPQGPQIVEAPVAPKAQRQPAQVAPAPPAPGPAFLAPPATVSRVKTPPSDDGEAEVAPREVPEYKKTSRPKNLKEKDEGVKDKIGAPVAGGKGGDAAVINESVLGQALTREIRRTEENLHTRIGRLISKEMDRQQQRLEDARAIDQGNDLTRQETILKLISDELSRNTTRVVGTAVRSEVQNSVLPALENVTRNEVRSALDDQVGARMSDYIQQGLSDELEKMLTRPDIAGHFSNLLSSALAPVIERQVKESVNKVFIPLYHQQASQMHQEVIRALQNEVSSVKSDLIAWHSDVIRSQEAIIRDLEGSVRGLSDQVKFLTLNPPVSQHHHQLSRSSPVSNSSQHGQHQPLARQTLQPTSQHQTFPPSIYQQPPQHQIQPPHLPPPLSHQQQHQQPQPPPSMHKLPPPTQGPSHNNWYTSNTIAAPQASHIAALPQAPPPPARRQTPPTKKEEWDDTYLAVLGTQDPRQLRELLSRSNPEVILPLNGRIPLSQAVVLTLVHRLSSQISETSPEDESFKSALWWLQRTAASLIPADPLISAYVGLVMPNIISILHSTKNRISSMSPPGAFMESIRLITDIQNTLSTK